MFDYKHPFAKTSPGCLQKGLWCKQRARDRRPRQNTMDVGSRSLGRATFPFSLQGICARFSIRTTPCNNGDVALRSEQI